MFDLAAVLVSALALGAPVPVTGVCPDGRRWTTSEPERAEMVQMVNLARAQWKRRPMTRMAVLDRMAQAHAADMACRNYFGHRNPERHKLTARLQRVSSGDEPDWERLAEVLGTSPDAFRQVQRWIDSRSHRLGLLDKAHDRLGVGLVRIAHGSRYRTYWAVEFITEGPDGARRAAADRRAEAQRPVEPAPAPMPTAGGARVAAATSAPAPVEPVRKPRPTPRVFPQPPGR